MFVPAHEQKLLLNAARIAADILLPDIEDSAPLPENKQIARDNIINSISEGLFNGRIIFPRVNDSESGQLLKDVYQLTIPGISGFMYPKVKKAEDVYFFSKLLETIECEKGFSPNTFKIIVLIETASAVMNIYDICSAAPERLIAIAFGCGDFIFDLGGSYDDIDGNIFTARSLIAMGARSKGIIPIDTVHLKVHDLDDLEKNLILSKKLGFEGMLVLNPKELPLVHKYYSPSQDDIIWANDILRLSEENTKEGFGVAHKEGIFVGPPLVKKARIILDRQSLINKQQ